MAYNKILLNHVGFPCNAPKRFVLADMDGAVPETFQVVRVHNVEETVVFTGKLVFEEYALGGAYVGHFDEVCEQGDYYILCGALRSRFFAIFDGIYSHPIRLMLSYFTYQRCGNELGWAGKCHMDDGILMETGEQIDLTGGYHQSCDLRKSPVGIAIGLYGMLRTACADRTDWGKILYREEIIHACDFYVKTISPEGIMYDTLSYPFGWSGRQFFKSPAPASGQWCATSVLALAASLIPERREIYLETALRSWKYLVSEERSAAPYKHPAETPRGMDLPGFFMLIYKGSEFDKAYRVCCAADFYRATGDVTWLDEVRKAESLNEEELCVTHTYYSWGGGGLFALTDAAELCGICRDKIRKVSEALSAKMNGDFWHRPVLVCNKKTLNQIVPRWGEDITFAEFLGNYRDLFSNYVYSHVEALSPGPAAELGVFLHKAARILQEKSLDILAQRLVDYFLGCNPMDGSHIESIGYNQPERGVWGQFFPPTPQIPGGVTIGFTAENNSSEYDMPAVGMLMWLLAQIAEDCA